MRAATLIFGLVFLVLNVAGQAATFNIADGDVAGLIAAIQTANANGETNILNLAPNGHYVLTTVADSSPDYQSSGAAGLPYVRSQLTINGNGATIQRSTASGTPNFVIIEVSGYTPAAQNNCQTGCINATLTLNGVTLTGGVGGLHLTYATAFLQNSTVTQNVETGIGNTCSSLTLLNSTVSYNTSNSAYGGGGVFMWQFSCPPSLPTTNIIFSTIYENSNPGWGRGNAIATNAGLPGSVVLKNSILASPSHPSENICNGNTALYLSLGHNIVGDASCELTGTGDMNSTDPLLGTTVDNGGLTPTDLPSPDSPSVNAVPLADCTDTSGVSVATDQRGVSRPQGAACDIGSVEVVLGPKYHTCLLYDTSKVVPSGATDPIKLQLCDAAGDDLSASTITLHAISITRVSTSISGTVQDAGNANPDNDFRFDSTLGSTGGYIFNLSTKGLTTGSYNLNFTVSGDTSTYSAPFQVK